MLTEIDETLDFNRDRVVEMALGYGYLVVSTTTQIYVYNVANFNTPYIFDSPETVSFIQLAEKFFLVLTPAAVAVYTYDGRKVSTPRFAGLRADRLSAPVLSLSPDLVAVVDSTDRRTVRLCDVMTGKPREPAVKHTADVAAVQLNQTPARQTHERQLLLVDRNDELWLYLCGTAEGHKLHTQVDSACWNETSEALCAIADGRLLVWGYPRVAFTDRDLLPGTLTTKDGAEFGQLAQVAPFRHDRRAARDGAQVTATVAPYRHAPRVRVAAPLGRGRRRLPLRRGPRLLVRARVDGARGVEPRRGRDLARRAARGRQAPVRLVRQVIRRRGANADRAYKRRPDDAGRPCCRRCRRWSIARSRCALRLPVGQGADLASSVGRVDTVWRTGPSTSTRIEDGDRRPPQLVDRRVELGRSSPSRTLRSARRRRGPAGPRRLKLPASVPAEGGGPRTTTSSPVGD